jgi:hypothetical protein
MEDTFDGMHVTNPVARHEKQAWVVQNVSSSLIWTERLLSTERATQLCDNSRHRSNPLGIARGDIVDLQIFIRAHPVVVVRLQGTSCVWNSNYAVTILRTHKFLLVCSPFMV